MTSETKQAPWNQFRGPNGSGVAVFARPPIEIGMNHTAWNVPLPAGQSSPILWNDTIFLTGLESERLVTVALARKSGRILWKKRVPEVPLVKVHAANSVAASTPCVDEKSLYVYFGSYGLLCYDHNGQERWNRPIPTPRSTYGMSTSPILYRDLLILVLDDSANLQGSRLSRSKVIALNKSNGKLVWETPRPFNRDGWSTPMIWKHTYGTDLAVLGQGRVYGYDPKTGEEKWYVSGFSRETIAVPVEGNGRLHVSSSMLGGRGDEKLDPEPFWSAVLQFDRNGNNQIERTEISEHFTIPFRPELPPGHPGFGYPLPKDPDQRRKRQLGFFERNDKNKDGVWSKDEFLASMSNSRTKPNLAAIRPGGEGDITDTHVFWNVRRGIPEIPSPVFHKNRLYFVRDGGMLSCVNAEIGEMVYQERIGATGQYSASPVIANDYVYLVSSRGVITVVKSGDDFSITHQEDLNVKVFATPAIDENTLYIRTVRGLMAFR